MNPPPLDEITIRACESYAFHGQLGLARQDLSFCSVVRDPQHADVWSANKAFAVSARSADEFGLLMDEVDDAFADLSYRHFIVDPSTPSSFVAHLALADYVEHAATIQMVLQGEPHVKPPWPPINVLAVETDTHWSRLRDLVLQDHAEGARTQGSALSEAVSDGIMTLYRARSGACQFFIAELDGQACGYGSGTNCPNGMGMVEDLFTLPSYRGQGIASAVIGHCIEYCRNRGTDAILIGSHANEPPKHLYRKLGFVPVCLTRAYIKPVERPVRA